MVIGIVVLRQIPLANETAGVAPVIIGVLTHRNDQPIGEPGYASSCGRTTTRQTG